MASGDPIESIAASSALSKSTARHETEEVHGSVEGARPVLETPISVRREPTNPEPPTTVTLRALQVASRNKEQRRMTEVWKASGGRRAGAVHHVLHHVRRRTSARYTPHAPMRQRNGWVMGSRFVGAAESAQNNAGAERALTMDANDEDPLLKELEESLPAGEEPPPITSSASNTSSSSRHKPPKWILGDLITQRAPSLPSMPQRTRNGRTCRHQAFERRGRGQRRHWIVRNREKGAIQAAPIGVEVLAHLSHSTHCPGHLARKSTLANCTL